MIVYALSAAFVGMVHSLSPGHWLPVVLLSKTRKWGVRDSVVAALIAASGHILVSSLIGIACFGIAASVVRDFGKAAEEYSGLALIAFGLAYAVYAWFRHSRCHGHEHHGPEPQTGKRPVLFLFTLGLSPCVAALPIFVAAAPRGLVGMGITLGAFALGVAVALVGATMLASSGLMKLDHPVFEHHGEVITGLGIALTGVLIFFHIGHGHDLDGAQMHDHAGEHSEVHLPAAP